jgi:hypothetical protein
VTTIPRPPADHGLFFLIPVTFPIFIRQPHNHTIKPMRIFFILLLLSITQIQSTAQSAKQKVFTEDIDHFWEAYDSVAVQNDSAHKVQQIQKLYIDRGTEGLHAFMKARNYSAALYEDLD